MKHLKTPQELNELSENLNISDVSESNSSYPLDEYKNLNDILSAHDVLDKLSFSEKRIKVFYTKDAPKDTTGNVMTMEDATLFAFEYAKRLLEEMNYSH
jgi:hypothetical protein